MHEPREQLEEFHEAVAFPPFLSLLFRDPWTKKMKMLEMMQLKKMMMMKRKKKRILLEMKVEIIAIFGTFPHQVVAQLLQPVKTCSKWSQWKN